MSSNIPIYSVAKELNVDSNRVILACKTLGINAKGATKRLNKDELAKVKSYFDTGKNVSEEIININEIKVNPQNKPPKNNKKTKISYFANRLIGKS